MPTLPIGWNQSNTVPLHGQTHEIRPFGAGGNDPLDIYSDALVGLRAQAQETPDMTVYVSQDWYNITSYTFWDGGDSPTFTAPTTAGTERIDLLYLDSTGTLLIATGTETPGFPTASIYPTPIIGTIPIAFIRLVYGQTSILNSDISSARVLWQTYSGAGTIPSPVLGSLLVGTATNWVALAKGTQYQTLQGGATTPGYDALHLDQATAITGLLPITNGGTGASTATAAFDALSPLTTLGDTIYRDASNNVRLAGNTTTTKKYLSQTGTGSVSAAPSWAQVDWTDLSSVPATFPPTAHDIISSHTYTGGAALDVFGLSAPNTMAKLTPSSNPGAASAILKTGSSGEATLSGTLTLAQPSSSDHKFLSFDAEDADARAFNYRAYAFVNPYGTRKNVVFRRGYNSGATLAEDVTEPAYYENLETYYRPDAGHIYYEWYHEYVNGATNFRPIGISVNQVDHVASIFYKADYTYFMGTDGTQYWSIYSGYLTGGNAASTIVKTVNNSAFLKQRNAAGSGNVDLMYLNSSDRIYFGATVESHTVSSTLTAQALSDTSPLIAKAYSTQTARMIRLEKSDGSLIGALTATPWSNTNVLLGALAGGATISGGTALYNIFVGRSAGGNVTGSGNVAIGDDALNGAVGSTAQNNFAMGTSTMVNATSAQSCVAIGTSALQNITDGKQCVAIGTSALGNSGVNPTDYVAIGFQAGYSGATVSVAIGSRALFSGASYATAIGYNALRNATGNSNVGVGMQAGYSNTGGSGVFLGYQAGYYETASNKLFIDNTQRASEADGRLKSLVYGIFNAAPASQSLTVNGVVIGQIQSALTNTIQNLATLDHQSTGTAAASFGSSLTWNLQSSTTASQTAALNTVLWTDATHASRTALVRSTAIGNALNTGYYGFWNHNAVAGTAITVIPDGTGDVTSNLTCVYSVKPSSGTASGGLVNIPLSGDSVIWSNDAGTETLTLTVAANGSVTIARSAGTITYGVSLYLVWI